MPEHAYRPDPDLQFLELVEPEDLEILFRYLAFDEKGEERLTSSLASSEHVVRDANGSLEVGPSWRRIAAELQHFGGDSIANAVRRKGVCYREVLSDVMRSQSIKAKGVEETPAMERILLSTLAERAWDKMTDKDRLAAAAELGIDRPHSTEQLVLRNVASTAQLVWIVAAATSKMMLPRFGIGVFAPVIGKTAGAALFPPFAVAIGSVYGASLVTGPAFRVTLPAVVQIAYMRQKALAEETC